MEHLQDWLENISLEVKEHKDCLERYARFLSQATRPWPLAQTPSKYQERYRCERERETANKERKIAESLVDDDLESVEVLLQKARLLHDKDPNKKPAITVKPGNNISEKSKKNPKPLSVARSKGVNVKPGKVLGKQPRPTINYNTRKPLSSRNPKSAKNSAGNLNSMSKQQDHRTLENLTNPDEIATKMVESGQEKKVDNKPLVSMVTSKEIPEKKLEIDPHNVKVDFREFLSDLEIPVKVRKLQNVHSKLRSQLGGYLQHGCCREEEDFVRKMLECDGARAKDVRTLESLNEELHAYLIVCGNAHSVLKYREQLKPSFRASKLRWSPQEEMYYQEEVLKIIQGISQQLSEKFDAFHDLEIVDFQTSDVTDRDKHGHDLISRLTPQLNDLEGLTDHTPYPANRLTFQDVNALSHWVCERLRHQCLLLERNLILRISKVYISLINHLLDAAKEDSSNTDVIRIIQNAFGLLAQKDILLPAFVLAE